MWDRERAPGFGDPTDLPRRRFGRRGPWRPVVAATATAAVLFAAFVLPVPFIFAYLPGPVRDVGPLVEVSDAKTYSSDGKLMLTTVSVDTSVTVAQWIAVVLDARKDAVLRDQVTGGLSIPELERRAAQDMRVSKRAAQEVALTALGYPPPAGKGARITFVEPGSPADGILRPGDRVVEIDGRRIRTTCDVGRAVDARNIADEMRISLRRGGDTRAVEVTTGESPFTPGSPYLGIGMADIDYRYAPGLRVRIKTGEIAGPSAGLMFALTLYDRLTEDDLTSGRTVAGTGTIECDGGIGAIGGIEQKVAAAEAAGAEVFLAPVANAGAARSVAGDIAVVAVATFDEALAFLQGSD